MQDLGSVKLRIYSPTGKSESVRPEPTRDSLGPASSNPGSDTSFSEVRDSFVRPITLDNLFDWSHLLHSL